MRPFLLAAVSLAIAGSSLLAQGPARAPLQVTEWKVPWENSGPRDPYRAAQGRVWLPGQRGNYIANLNPATGKFTRYEIQPGTNPHTLIIDTTRRVCFAG